MKGFFGGTFDPIHFGHLNLAIQLFEIHKLSTVLFCPAFCSPFKTEMPPLASPEHRLAMLRLALEDFPPFEISTLELDRQGPSYTVDTLRALQPQKFRLLLSDDAAAHLSRWKDSSQLLRLAPPLIGTRTNSDFPHATPINVMEISSTDIRERLQRNLCCAHLIPAKVLDYIHRHQLYFSLGQK